jgi:exonuclease VII small subunit
VKLAEACRAKLDQAEQAIKTLVKESEGKFSLEDFDESS